MLPHVNTCESLWIAWINKIFFCASEGIDIGICITKRQIRLVPINEITFGEPLQKQTMQLKKYLKWINELHFTGGRMQSVKVALGSREMTVNVATQCAKDRTDWRALVHMKMIVWDAAIIALFLCSFRPASSLCLLNSRKFMGCRYMMLLKMSCKRA